MDFPEADDPLEQIADRIVKKAVKSSPWLVLSLGFHGAIFAVLPLVIFCERLREPEAIPVHISVDAIRIDPDRNYKPVSGGPPSSDGAGLDEPTIQFPNAAPAERNESADKQDHAQISGESLAALGHLGDEGLPGTFRGRLLAGPPGTNDVMGVAGGSGRGGFRFGGKLGGRKNLVARGGGSAATEAAVEAGLAWLARHQASDGHWVGSGDHLRCESCSVDGQLAGCDLGVTALAVLAFIDAGYGPNCGEGTVRDTRTGRLLKYGETVRAGLRWLEKHQDEHGRFEGQWSGGENLPPMYNQAFATLAFCEAYRSTKGESFRAVAERGVSWLQNNRGYTTGWRYVANAGAADLSVTGACVQAMRGAQLAGLSVSEKTRAGVESFLAKITGSNGCAGYMEGQRKLGASLPAIGLYVRKFVAPTHVDEKHDAVAQVIVKNVISKTGYAADWAFESDFYCWYYAMLSLFDSEGPRGASFRAVNDFVTKKLCSLQKKSGCADGSWDTADDLYTRYGGGRACATAMNVLTLEVYYRYVTDDAVATTTSHDAPSSTPIDRR